MGGHRTAPARSPVASPRDLSAALCGPPASGELRSPPTPLRVLKNERRRGRRPRRRDAFNVCIPGAGAPQRRGARSIHSPVLRSARRAKLSAFGRLFPSCINQAHFPPLSFALGPRAHAPRPEAELRQRLSPSWLPVANGTSGDPPQPPLGALCASPVRPRRGGPRRGGEAVCPCPWRGDLSLGRAAPSQCSAPAGAPLPRLLLNTETFANPTRLRHVLNLL